MIFTLSTLFLNCLHMYLMTFFNWMTNFDQCDNVKKESFVYEEYVPGINGGVYHDEEVRRCSGGCCWEEMSAPYFPKFVRRPFFQWLHIILFSKRSSLVMVTSQKTLKICFLSFVVTMALVFFLVLSLHRVILSPKQRTQHYYTTPKAFFVHYFQTDFSWFSHWGAHCSRYFKS